ncbi:FAD-dependent oxidoreductase [bacterium]|nr:FAD-dependent oxidoreductase [bacterium]
MASKRVLIVGGVAGGASCAARLRRMDEEAEIVMFEKGPYVSFANCGLPYHVGDVIKEEGSLQVANPTLFRNRFNIDVRVNHEVTAIDREAKTVEVCDTHSGEVTTESYDTLVLSPGSKPIIPPIKGVDREGVFRCLTIPDTKAIREWIVSRQARSAVVIGGGYIGLEMAENLRHRGLEVMLVEMQPQVMPLLDPEMMTEVHAHLQEKGIHLRLGAQVQEIDGPEGGPLTVRLGTGEELEADLAIMAVGGRPNTDLAKAAGLEIGTTGGVATDDQMRTSDPNVFAVGDVAEIKDSITGRKALVPLAGPANRQGRVAADVIAGREAKFRGAQSTAVVGVFDLTVATTGSSEKQLRRAGVPFQKVYLFPGNHVGYYPGAQPIHLKVLFRPKDGQLLSAQAVGRAGVEKRIDVIATLIQMGGTVFDMEEVELCYAPQFGAAKDPVNMAGFIAANHLRGDSPLTHWDDVAEAEGDPLIVDVREPEEFEAGHVEGAINVPLSQMRDRLDELPKDREVWCHCGVGQRSYYAVRVLRQNGIDARNLSGGMNEYMRQK